MQVSQKLINVEVLSNKACKFDFFFFFKKNKICCRFIKIEGPGYFAVVWNRFPGVIESKKHDNLRVAIFSIFDSMVLGYSGIDNRNI